MPYDPAQTYNDYRRSKGCARKRPFRSLKLAQKGAVSAMGMYNVPIEAYACEFCGLWYIGRPEPLPPARAHQ